MTDIPTRHDEGASRFVAELDGGDAYLTYTRVRPGVLDLRHTVVPASERGQGVADALVRAALAYARQHGDRIIPTCPYVKEWLEGHPEEKELVVAE